MGSALGLRVQGRVKEGGGRKVQCRVWTVVCRIERIAVSQRDSQQCHGHLSTCSPLNTMYSLKYSTV